VNRRVFFPDPHVGILSAFKKPVCGKSGLLRGGHILAHLVFIRVENKVLILPGIVGSRRYVRLVSERKSPQVFDLANILRLDLVLIKNLTVVTAVRVELGPYEVGKLAVPVLSLFIKGHPVPVTRV